MTPATVLVSKPAKRAMPWSSWTTMSPVRRSVKQRSRPRPLRVGRVRRLAAVDQAVLGEGGELEAGGDEAVAQVGLGEDQAGGAAVEVGLQAREVVGGALGGAALRPGDDGRVAGAGELLQLGLGLLERCGRRSRRPGRGSRSAGRREIEREPDRGAVAERVEDAVGLDVEVVGVLVVERDADVGPVVAQARLDVLVGGDHDLRGSGIRSSSSRKRSTGSSSAMSGRSSSLAPRSRPARGARAPARRRARSRPRRPRRGCAG